MKILFLSHKIPYPPNKGDRIPAYYRFMHWAKQHQVSLAFPCFEKKELKYIEQLIPYARSIDTELINPKLAKLMSLFYLFSKKPLTLPYFYSKALAEKIKARIAKEDFDLIYVYSSSMAQYVIDVFGIKKIIDLGDSDSHKWLQYAQYSRFPLSVIYRREGRCLEEYEKLLAEAFDYTIAISEAEKELFHTYIPNREIGVVSNGVDADYYKPQARSQVTRSQVTRSQVTRSQVTGHKSQGGEDTQYLPAGRQAQYDKNRIIFVGAMDYFANVDAVTYFCRSIFPLIREKIPGVEFYIVGAKPTGQVRCLSRDKRVTVTGFVNDVRPFLKKASVCVVPLRIAQGMQNKILQSMACGVPVVTTEKGNQGIRAKSGESIMVGDDAQTFAQAVVHLMLNKELRQKLALNGRRFVMSNFNWKRNMDKLEGILAEVVDSM